jgi:DNA-binding MarR family transcriptional regulator
MDFESMSAQETFLIAMENWVNTYLFRSLSDYFDYLKRENISMQQAYALTFIHYNGSGRMSDFRDYMMITAAAASQMVDRLEKQNLVQRVADSTDKRVRRVALSEKGQTFVEQSIAARQGWIQEIPDNLTDAQLAHISSALQLLTSVYQANTFTVDNG